MVLLNRLHANSKEIDAKDNIVAASCRIVEFQLLPLPPAQRPLDLHEMVNSIFSQIPFVGDETENETIINFAIKLYEVD